MQVKHRFISNVPDDPAADAAGQVLPSHWNQDHEFLVEPLSLVGNDGDVTTPAKAISVSHGLRLSAGALSLLGVPVFFQPTEPIEQGPFVWVSPDPETGLSLSAKDEMGQLLQLDSQTLTLTAQAPLMAYKVLTTDDQGFAIYADAGTLAHADQVVGVGTNAGTSIKVAEYGEVTNPGWNWIPGQPLFLGLNGDISTAPRLGVFNVQIGYAKTANSIIVKIGRSIILG